MFLDLYVVSSRCYTQGTPVFYECLGKDLQIMFKQDWTVGIILVTILLSLASLNSFLSREIFDRSDKTNLDS